MLDNQKNLMSRDITIGNETIDYETAVLLGIIKPDKNDDFNLKNVVIDKESDKISADELYDKLPFLKG
jgi:U3 small nucleolar RNA-associated protein 14